MQENCRGKNWYIKLMIVLSLVVLCIPSSTLWCVHVSAEQNVVQITTEVCGTRGIPSQTVELTEPRYQEFQKALDDLKVRFQHTETRAEAVVVFREAVLLFDTYGLLPQELSKEQATSLVAAGFGGEQHFRQRLQHAFSPNMDDSGRNYLCLTMGSVDNVDILTPVTAALLPTAALGALILFFYFDGDPAITDLQILFALVAIAAYFVGFYYTYLTPFVLFSILQFSSAAATNGWLATLGLLGIQTANGRLYGGLYGFTGLKLYIGGTELFLLGSTLVSQVTDAE